MQKLIWHVLVYSSLQTLNSSTYILWYILTGLRLHKVGLEHPYKQISDLEEADHDFII